MSMNFLKLRDKTVFIGTVYEYVKHFFDISDGHLHSLNIVDEAGNLQGFTHKIIDLEEADKETMHLLVFLLMQFLSRQDQVRIYYSIKILSNSTRLNKEVSIQ